MFVSFWVWDCGLLEFKKRVHRKMRLSLSLSRRIRQVLVSVFGIFAMFYFVFHIFHGERGLIVWGKLRQQVVTATNMAKIMAAERRYLENKVRLLHPESLDPDMLDERARLMLNFGYPDELIILRPMPKGLYSPERS